MLRAFDKTTIGILSALSGFISFSCADASAKWLSASYDFFTVIFWSYLVSLVFGFCLLPFFGGIKRTLKTRKLFVHIGRGVCAFGIAACVVKAMGMGLPLANMYTILFLAPFLITIGAWPVYGERVPLRNWGIIALGFCGILVAYPPGYNPITEEEMYAFLALAFIVGLSLLARPLSDEESLHSLSFYPAVVILILSMPLVWSDLTLPAPQHWPVFILNGMFVTWGLTGIAYGFRHAPYSLVAPLHYVQMVIAIVLGYLIFDDVPTWLMLGGASLIIISGVLLIRTKKKVENPEASVF